MRSIIRGFLAIVCTLFISLNATAAIDAYEFESDKQAQEFRELTLELRCPKCQNNSIGDSNAIIATDMKDKVYELLQKGESKEEVINYMVDRYGNFVTYNPPLNAATIILWAGPMLFLMFGLAFIIYLSKRRGRNEKSDVALSSQEQARLDELLKEDKSAKRGNKS